MTSKTTYRVYEKKGVKYLQYLKLYKFLFIKWYDWEYVPYPDKKDKQQVLTDKDSKYKNLKRFILDYLDIEDYFKTEYVERKNKFKKTNNK